ncbi:MAG TPA: hypothetical protein VGT78_14755 [Rhizomicrobium sp.]|nr:hypothetical protein [Rhizomicrobium sp.]
MKILLAAGAVFVALSLASPCFAQTQFSTEQQAQQHCPNDTIVWLNLRTGVYHFRGERWYGMTKNGTFVCKQEADQAGDRATRNGQ